MTTTGVTGATTDTLTTGTTGSTSAVTTGGTTGATTTGTSGRTTAGTTDATTTGATTSGTTSGDAGGPGGPEAGMGDASVPTPTGQPTLTTVSVEVTKEFQAEQPMFNVTRPVELTEPGFLLPVIVWANGGCFRSDFTWQPLFDRWAGAGFVVLSLTSSDGMGNGIGAILEGTTSKAEHSALIDWVVAQNGSGPYAGMMDLDKIVVAGNSCGGVTAEETAAADDRVAAIFVLSGSSAVGSVNLEVMKNIHVPLGFIVGGMEDDIAAPNALADFEALNEGVAGMLVNRFEGEHQFVSTDPEVAPEVAEIALNWMDLALYGTREAYDALNSANVCDNCTPSHWSMMQRNLDTLIQ